MLWDTDGNAFQMKDEGNKENRHITTQASVTGRDSSGASQTNQAAEPQRTCAFKAGHRRPDEWWAPNPRLRIILAHTPQLFPACSSSPDSIRIIINKASALRTRRRHGHFKYQKKKKRMNKTERKAGRILPPGDKSWNRFPWVPEGKNENSFSLKWRSNKRCWWIKIRWRDNRRWSEWTQQDQESSEREK